MARHIGLRIALLLLIGSLEVFSQKVEFQCKTGWNLNPKANTCYKAFKEELQWTNAWAQCLREGGKLTEPDDAYITKYLATDMTKVSQKTTGSYWSGWNRKLKVPAATDDMLDASGALSKTGVGKWAPNQPDINKGKCVKIDLKGQWAFEKCKEKMPFICQRPSCSKDQFQCSDGICIKNEFKCNKINDCKDESDESNCPNRCRHEYASNPSGSISSGSPYSTNTDCQYTINIPGLNKVKLQFTRLDLAYGSAVEIWTGGASLYTSERLTTLVGPLNTAPSTPFLSCNNFLIMKFYSDGKNTAGGFTVSYSSVPNTASGYDTGRELTATSSSQLVQSPGYPNFYYPCSDVVWTIKVADKRVVTLELTAFELNNKEDKVIVQDGDSAADTILYTYTTETFKDRPYVTSTKNALRIHFETINKMTNSKGFEFKYREGCKFDFTGQTSGLIISPGYGTDTYAPYQDCEWKVNVNKAIDVTLKFQEKYGIGAATGAAVEKDILTIYNGDSTTAAKLFTSTAPSTTIPTQQYKCTGGKCLVTFKTNGHGTAAGFKIFYSMACENWQFATPAQTTGTVSNVYEATYSVACASGNSFVEQEYAKVKSVTLKCEAGGLWNQKNKPSCSKTVCGPPTSVANGFVKASTGIQFGNTVTFECFAGFTMTGNAMITCQDTWSTPPQCKRQGCGTTLADVTNCERKVKNGDGTGFGSVIEYIAKPGYEIKGTPVFICKEGKWTPVNAQGSLVMPTCEAVSCPNEPLKELKNIQTPAAGPFKFGNKVTISCKTGYKIKGAAVTQTSREVTCGTSRKFDNLPECENIDECATNNGGCEAGKATCHDNEGSFECKCKEGYSLNADKKTCADIKECASTTLNKCVKPDATCSDAVPGTYTCTCKTGYVLFTKDGTSGYKLCQGETGTKQQDTYFINHKCVKRTCDKPADVANGINENPQEFYRYEDKVKFSCKIGFTISGGDTITCLDTGKWDKAPPTCQAIKCQPLIVKADEAARVTMTPSIAVNYLQAVSIQCKTVGFGIVTKTATCRYDMVSKTYKLLGATAECPERSCNKPPQDYLSGAKDPETTLNGKYFVGQKFKFECLSAAYKMEGTNGIANFEVECRSDGTWNFGSLRCKGPSCSDPGRPAGGEQEAKSYEHNSEVKFTCKLPGFKPQPETPMVCQVNNGNPSWKGQVPVCKDMEKPTFSGCNTATQTVDKYSVLNYVAPTATDNSKGIPIVTYSMVPGETVAQDSTVTIAAKDEAGNTAECKFEVKIKDTTPPIITCPTVIYETLKSETENLQLQFDTAKKVAGKHASSSEKDVTVQHFPSTVAVNLASLEKVTTVDAKITDKAGNKAQCKFQVQVKAAACVDWDVGVPRNGKKNCKAISGGRECTFTCNTNYIFADQSTSKKTTCSASNNNKWTPDKYHVPDCVLSSPAIYRQEVKLRYNARQTLTSVCDLQKYLSNFKSKMEQLVTAANSHLGNTLNNKARVFLYPESTTITLDPTSPNYRALIIVTSWKIDANGETQANLDTAKTYVQSKVNDARFKGANTYIYEVSSEISTCPILDLTEWTDTVNKQWDEGVSCEDGKKLYSSPKTICVPCAPGTKYDKNSKACVDCPAGEYQDQDGQMTCKKCPTGTKSVYPQTRWEGHCFKLCPAGMFSSTGAEPCNACAVDTYSAPGQTSCTQCPQDTSTKAAVGSAAKTECKAQCPIGQYSVSGYLPCLDCPVGFYQDTKGQKQCKECASDKSTAATASFSLAQCIDRKDKICENACSGNSVSCAVVKHTKKCTCKPGFYGLDCKTQFSACSSSPCYNGGKCTDKGAGYSCQCPSTEVCTTSKETNKKRIDLPDEVKESIASEDACATLCKDSAVCKQAGYDSSNKRCFIFKTIDDSKLTTVNGLVLIRKSCAPKPESTGTRCETLDVKYCSKGNTCVKEKSWCQDKIGGYNCLCNQGYTGTNCNADAVHRCDTSPNPCKNNGVCTKTSSQRFRCQCAAGYTGRFCDDKIDMCKINPCLYGGVCTTGVNTYTCKCPLGYSGQNCEVRRDCASGNPCSSGGTCIDEIETSKMKCACPNLYTAVAQTDTAFPKCEKKKACLPNPCVKGGCTETSSNQCGYTCQCPPGYSGARCQYNDDNCKVNPCKNNGVCKDGENKYECTCPTGTSGTNCEINADNCVGSPCGSNGQCIDGINTFTCKCNIGYSGPKCETQIDLCALNTPCQHGGVCEKKVNDYTCKCDNTGWEGRNCEIMKKTCATTTCQNKGTCIDLFKGSFCQCASGTHGDKCQNAVSMCSKINSCVNNGQCKDVGGASECTCPTGWTGKSCESRLSPCHPDNKYCKNDGVCSIPGPVCKCKDGFSGSTCATAVDMCSGKSCGTGACVNLGTEYMCRCPKGGNKVGRHCEYDVTNDMLDFDMCFRAEFSLATSPGWFHLAADELAISFWVKFEQANGKGSILKLEGKASDKATDVETVLEIKATEIEVYCGTAKMTANYGGMNINDGKWHMVAVSWSKNSGEATLHVDGALKATSPKITNMCLGKTRPALGKVTLGNWETTPSGFRGCLSRVTVFNKILTDDFATRLFKKEVITSNLLLPWPAFLLKMTVERITPSKVGEVDPAPVTKPEAVKCPDNTEILTASRLSQMPSTAPTWNAATDKNSVSHTIDAKVPVGSYSWGKYQRVYTAFSTSKFLATCQNKVFFQQKGLGDCSKDPEAPPTVSVTCSPGTDDKKRKFKSCTATCKASDGFFLQPIAKQINCGPSGVWVLDKPELPYTLTPCGKKTPAKRKIILKLLHSLTSCDQSQKNARAATIVNALKSLNSGNSQKICASSLCSSATTTWVCPKGRRRRRSYLLRRYKRATTAESTTTFTTGTDCKLPGTTTDLSTVVASAVHTQQFSNTGGSVSTEPDCDPGKQAMQDANNCWVCVECSAGTYYVSSTKKCADCEKGKYQDLAAQTSCKDCGTGKTTITTRTDSLSKCILECEAGNYYDSTTKTCLKCKIGFYQDRKGQVSCVSCGTGKTTVNEGSNALLHCVADCPSGTELQTTGCVECPRGKYRAQGIDLKCTDCKAGFTTKTTKSVSSNDCNILKCPKGQQPNVGNTQCEPCPLDKYQDIANELACKPCPANTGTKVTGADVQAKCEKFCESGKEMINAVCTPCPRKKYKDNSKKAGLAKFDPCESCPVDKTTDPTGSKLEADCKYAACAKGQELDGFACKDCLTGKFQDVLYPATTDKCKDCPTGQTTPGPKSESTACKKFCPDGQEVDTAGTACVACKQGFYKSNTPDPFAKCTACISTMTTAGTASTKVADCKYPKCTAGQQVKDTVNPFVCEDCAYGFYQEKEQPITEKCLQCPANHWTETKKTAKQSLCKPYCESGQELKSGQCVKCQVGYYKDNTASDTARLAICTKCPNTDFITAAEGSKKSTDCTVRACLKGTFRNTPLNLCVDCPRGTYTDKDYQTQCTQCPTGKTTVSAKSALATDCKKDCPAGQTDVKDVCTNCPVGFYKPTQGPAGCTKCGSEKSTASTGAKTDTECTVVWCNPGRFNSAGTCKACPKGRYNDKSGQDQCPLCPQGQTTQSEGSVTQTDCVPDCQSGEQLDTATKICKPCPRESYRDKAKDGDKCKPCTNGKTTPGEGATGVDKCNTPICPKGQYLNKVKKACAPCPLGEYNDKTNQEDCLKCPDRKYTKVTGSQSPQDCIDACTAAPTTYCKNAGKCDTVTHTCECKPRYHGLRCENEQPFTNEQNTIAFAVMGAVAAVLIIAGIILAIALCNRAPAAAAGTTPLLAQPMYRPPQAMHHPIKPKMAPSYANNGFGAGHTIPPPQQYPPSATYQAQMPRSPSQISGPTMAQNPAEQSRMAVFYDESLAGDIPMNTFRP